MVSGIGNEFKIPIGYFLIQSLCAEERAAIIHEAMFKLYKIGVDGDSANIAAGKILGANYYENTPYFKNPFDERRLVYMILDPSHVIKLLRNCLGNKKKNYDSENNEISWSYLENLVNLQISENVNFGNKLTKTHLHFDKMKMNVRLAIQTLSNSSADSIEYLNKVKKNINFCNSESTVEYFRLCNNMIDVMNSKRNHCNDKYKQPISEETINNIETLFEYVRKYIEGLYLIEDDKKKMILKSKSFTPFFGLYHNTTSLIGIYNDYVKRSKYKEFYTFNISQDHLESLYGCIRRMGGSVFVPL